MPVELGDNFRQVGGDTAFQVMQMLEAARDMQYVFGGEDGAEEARKTANRKKAIATRENKLKRSKRVQAKKKRQDNGKTWNDRESRR